MKTVFVARYIKYPLVRLILRTGSLVITRMNKEHTFIHPTEDKSAVFYSCLPEKEVDDIIATYIGIFTEPPWNEEWTYDMVLKKLLSEVADTADSFLAVCGGVENPAGFSWGAIVQAESLQKRIAPALGVSPDSLVGLVDTLKRRSASRILYFDEFAVARRSRGTVWPIRFLFKSGLELGFKNGIDKTMFWSTPESRITTLALHMGYEPVYTMMVRGKKIVFLFHPDVTSLLRIACNINDRNVVLLKRTASFFMGKGK